MRKSLLVSILAIQLIGLFILAATMQFNALALYASAPLLQTETPQPFLGSIYYGQEDVWQVFDHQFPGSSDNNNYVVHHDGTIHTPITLTPLAGTTPTPGPTAAYIPGGYGYTSHLGIDYSLEYEPVLAAANGEVIEAGWSYPANHRLGYGLHVRMTYTANENYEIWYGHLSALVAETGQTITIDPENPGDRNRIIGISGNTGHVFGIGGLGCGPITGQPETSTCGQHLHLEVRTLADVVVNPYGWIGTTTPDPWAGHPSGEISYNLWATRPALISGADQYPGAGDVGLPEPEVDEISLLIDDTSSDFSIEGDCFEDDTGSQSYNNSYRYTYVNAKEGCCAQWNIEPDAYAPPGEYDIYVHIPDHEDATLNAIYTIEHNEETSIAHVVQLVYPNNEHSAWAYIGRYDFALDGNITEYVQVDNDDGAFEDGANEGRIVLADAIKLVPAQTYQLPAEILYFSWTSDVIIDDTYYSKEDIVIYDALNGIWDMYFDGSDVGLLGINVDAFTLLADGSILLSINEPVEKLGDLEGVDDSDIVRFVPTSTGQATSGSFELYLNGATYGLSDVPGVDTDLVTFIGSFSCPDIYIGAFLSSCTNDSSYPFFKRVKMS